MINYLIKLTGFVVFSSASLMAAENTIWADRPAVDSNKDYEQSYPIGNGRLGALIYGGTDQEQIILNEDTLWIGDEEDTGSYQMFGPLLIDFQKSDQESGGEGGNSVSKSYRRELDIDQSLHTVTYSQNGVQYKREAFASNPANVMVFRFSADKGGAYSGVISLKDTHQGKVKANGNILSMSGALKNRYKSSKSDYKINLQYEAQVMVVNQGGELETKDGKMSFKNCDGLMILVDAGTDYLNQREQGWKQEHPHQRISDRLNKASKKSFDDLLTEHVADYQKLYQRVNLNLGDSPQDALALPTPSRVDRYRGRKLKHKPGVHYDKIAIGVDGGKSDPDLEELIFNYARYLMISCSREGCMPANLQGLWNKDNNPPWRSDYHTDINLQMNYWFVGPANLSDCFTPVSEWLYSVVPVKREATKKAFGVRGWAHRAENGIFGGASFKWYIGDGAWLMQNLWDHYTFTLDQEYLETRAYPLLKELCEFWEDSLIERKDGKLVSPKGQSPEHGPEREGNSYEQQLVYNLFTNYIEASSILGRDEAFRKKVTSLRSRLLGPQIGKWGQLQEWDEDMDDPNNKHRHLSHLLAVYPLKQISPTKTPKLAGAAKVSLNARGDGGTGWSKAFKIGVWARLHDGNRAYKLLKEQINGNFYGNLLSFHAPFQIDANFGYAAGVCEMLMQSQTGVVQLLPALPNAWKTGSVKGIKARGGFEVDLDWKDGKLTEVKVTSLKGQPMKLQYGDQLKELKTVAGETYTFNASLK